MEQFARDMHGMLCSLLECPVCVNSMSAPIYQCQNGHSLCQSCTGRMNNCPSCQGPFSNVRNRVLEEISESFLHPCVNQDAGCCARLLVPERTVHEHLCSYRPYECLPLGDSGCTWRGARVLLYEHIRTAHASGYLYAEIPRLVDVNTSVDMNCTRLAALGPDLFWVYIKQDVKSSKYFRAVQYLGPDEGAAKFQFSYAFDINGDKSTIIRYQRKVYSERDDINAEYALDNSFSHVVACVKACVRRYCMLLKCQMNIERIDESPVQNED